ncbi:helix-turn-helix domain-containing protein [Pseudomonas asplenii]|uniref:AraC-like ligand-binding domain-containing protein n=1 Tax=Pseudomonas asplenii TaxID=53407 RepID=UPI0006B66FD0|nr:helix-turn-helix domain-containing protein [Pseudomonas fuscovaginae]KPA95910.1 DNA-binding domain-containing protein, AraC-type [Pseudomonas fuscovaginae]
MTTSISTACVPASERVGFWDDISSRFFVKLDCQLDGFSSNAAPGGFEAQLKHSRFGSLDLIDLQASAHSVERRVSGGSDQHYFILSLITHGLCELTQDDRRCAAGVGDIVLYDTRRPYRIVLPRAFRMCSLRIPQETMRLYNPAAERAVSRPLTPANTMGRILGGLMLTLFQEQEHAAEFGEEAMARPLLEMLSLGLQSLGKGEADSACTRLVQFHLERIKSLIDNHLAEPLLSVEWIAEQLKMSVSSVHRVFSGQPVSASEYIWGKRLELCRMALANPCLRDRSISDIAYSWGFSSNAHFSRVFKRHLGMSPREYRALSLATQ